MRFLVLGASGMAGHVISLYLKERGHDVVGFARRDAGLVQTVLGDVRDYDKLAALIRGNRFDVVVNAAGLLVKVAELHPADAYAVNAGLPHVLAAIMADSDTRVFHMSTDCVFAGNTGPYTETSVPDGTSLYDRTKAAGELRDSKNLTFRNSIVGPDLSPSGVGLFNWFMAQDGPVQGFTGAIWTGLTALELAKAMETAAQENVAGLVNMVPDASISKFDLLGHFNHYCRDGRVQINPDDGLQLDKALVRTNFDSAFRPQPYEQQVADMARWIADHQDLYPHYWLKG